VFSSAYHYWKQYTPKEYYDKYLKCETRLIEEDAPLPEQPRRVEPSAVSLLVGIGSEPGAQVERGEEREGDRGEEDAPIREEVESRILVVNQMVEREAQQGEASQNPVACLEVLVRPWRRAKVVVC